MPNNNITNKQELSIQSNLGEDISNFNKEVLVHFGKRCSRSLGKNEFPSLDKGIWEFCKSLFPKGFTSEMFGKQLAKDLVEKFGAPVTKESVDIVVKNVLKPEMAKQTTLTGLMLKQFIETPKLVVGEATKYVINSNAMPVIKGFASAIGGWGIPALCVLVDTVYNKYLKNPAHLATLEKLPLKDLFKYDEESKSFKDAFGNVLTAEDIYDITEVVTQYDLTSKLLILKKKEVENFVKNYIKKDPTNLYKDGLIAVICSYITALIECCSKARADQPERFVYLDGKELTPDEVKDMKEAIRLLTNNNPTGKKESIINLIKGIAQHIR